MRGWCVMLVVAATSCGPRGSPIPGPGTAADPVRDAGSIAHEPPPPRPPLQAPAALDDRARPRAYRLSLALDPDAAGYHGEIEIDLELARAQQVIWLHAAAPLRVTGASARVAGTAAPIDALRASDPGDAGIIGVELARELPAGAATLILRFEGTYRDADALFVQEVRGRRYVYTDFEPIDARRAFPCLDEPRWKAPWTVTVRAPEAMGVYGNAPVEARTRQGDGWVATRFAATPPLPTYLIAVAVGPFDVVEVPGAPVPSRILVPEGRAAAAAAAAELLGPLMRRAVKLIDRPIPFPKIDVAVVPSFGGAMENPGLITIAADFALAPADAEARRMLARILAHEIAHLWFGDQVTLADWRELWLNEGAASWMADEIVDAEYPDLRVALEILDDRAEAMMEDALPGAHALRPERISHARQLFDPISYKKGAAVWRALEAWLGEERFRQALGAYLDAHAWGSVTTADLTRILAAAAPELPVADVIAAAVERAGVPALLVDVTCKDGRNQARLRLDGPRRPTVACVRWGDRAGAGAGRACVVVDVAATVDLGARCPAWVHPGAGGDGYYQWRLARAWWPALGRAPLTATELRDAVDMLVPALAAGAVGLAEIRPLLAAAVRSAEHRTTLPALELIRLAMRLTSPADARALASELRAATDDALDRIGTSPRRNEPPGRRDTRAALLRAAGELAGERDAIAWARRQLEEWQRGAALPDDVAEPALIVAAAHAQRGQRAHLLAAARRSEGHGDAVAFAIGRALAVLPGDTGLAALRDRGPAPLDRRAELGLVAELLADPQRADAALAALGSAATFYPPVLKHGPWCATPARRDDTAPAVLRHADAIAAWRAERCRAVAARLGER